jgi:predicted metal-dependent HD superfamily phosphohydrolase
MRTSRTRRVRSSWPENNHAALAAFDRLLACYREPHRHYHNLSHIAEMLDIIDRLQDLTPNPHAVRLAVWYHDAIYDPRDKYNEERSAALAGLELERIGVDPEVTRDVQRLILLTKHGPVEEVDADAAVLLDADLAILGARPQRYAAYAQAIRREYAWVPDDAYRLGRSKVLREFLDRPRLFRTDVMFGDREAQARRNMASELARPQLDR